MSDRQGNWMQTFTGIAFWPLDPRVEEIDIADIAHALSNLCRFGGHVMNFYSVAEHCVLMSHAVPAEDALWALLHDATEAYLCDLPRPIKRVIPQYGEIEDNLMSFICKKYGLAPEMPASVKDADNRILLDERGALLSTPPMAWHSETESLPPLGVKINRWRPWEAEWHYHARLNELLIPQGDTNV